MRFGMGKTGEKLRSVGRLLEIPLNFYYCQFYLQFAAFFDHILTFTEHSSHNSAFLSLVNCFIVLGCTTIMWSTFQPASSLEYKRGVANRLAAVFDILSMSRCCSVFPHAVIVCYTANVKTSHMHCPVIDCHIKNVSVCLQVKVDVSRGTVKTNAAATTEYANMTNSTKVDANPSSNSALGQNVSGTGDGEVMSSFRPANSAKLYASPEDVKSVGYRSRSLPAHSSRPQVC